ncbi:MAG: hypothetical protein ACRD1K_15765 [Acidimicrobiales bacterium]
MTEQTTSELLLTVTIRHEGYNRGKLVPGRIDKWIENQCTLPTWARAG